MENYTEILDQIANGTYENPPIEEISSNPEFFKALEMAIQQRIDKLFSMAEKRKNDK